MAKVLNTRVKAGGEGFLWDSNFAFTLAEMMVVMLILTILLAAFAPLMTKRKSVDLSSSPWKYASNNSDIYYGLADSQTAMIGQNTKSSSDISSRLILNTSSTDQAHIMFKKNSDTVGRLQIDNYNFLFGSAFNSTRTGAYNTAFGAGALAELGDSTGNTAFGYHALNKEIDGHYNTAFGYQALSASDDGRDNVAVGSNALAANTNGTYNTAVGSGALSNNTSGGGNTAVGSSALQNNTTENANTAVGNIALQNNTTGGANTAVGSGALHDNTTGGYNTAVGVLTLALNTAGSNNTAVGNAACSFVTGSNKTCIGASSGPTTTDSTTTDIVYLGTSSTTAIVSGVTGITTYSDKRLKNVKSEYKSGIEAIREIEPVNFTYKNDKDKTLRVGVIAQDLQKVLSDAVEKNGDGYLVVNQGNLFYTLLNAVKQLDNLVQGIISELKIAVIKISAHEDEIKRLQKENAELKSRIEKLEKAVF